MAFASMHEGIWQCNGCGRVHPEYVNGCVEDHEPPRKVVLVIEEPGVDPVPQPGALMNLNHRLSWRQRAAITKQWRTAAGWAATMLGPLSARVHDHRFVQMVIPVPDRRRRDPSNLIPLLKAAIDGCVDAGIWPDDTPEYVTTVEPYLFVQRPTLGEAATIHLELKTQLSIHDFPETHPT